MRATPRTPSTRPVATATGLLLAVLGLLLTTLAVPPPAAAADGTFRLDLDDWNGAPLSGASVTFYRYNLPGGTYQETITGTPTGSTGTSTTTLPPGYYYVRVSAAGFGGGYLRDGGVTPFLADSDAFGVPDGGTVDETTALEPSATVTGRVVAPDGTGVGGSCAIRPDVQAPSGWSGGARFVDAPCDFELTGLLAGTYRFRASSRDTEAAFDPIYWGSATDPDDARTVEVRPGENLDIGAIRVFAPGTGPYVETLGSPSVRGRFRVGGALVAVAPPLSPAAAVTTYQWLRDGVDIDGATSRRYEPAAADVGHDVSVRVRGFRLDYRFGGGASSTPVTVRKGRATNVRRPQVLGRTKVGRRVRVARDRWHPSGARKTIRWKAGNRTVRGATSRRLRVRPWMRGKRLRARVVVRAPGWTTTSAWTAPSRRVRR